MVLAKSGTNFHLYNLPHMEVVKFDFKKIYQMLPRPYLGSYSGEKGHQLFHKPCILALAKSVETFFGFNT